MLEMVNCSSMKRKSTLENYSKLRRNRSNVVQPKGTGVFNLPMRKDIHDNAILNIDREVKSLVLYGIR